MFAVDLRKVETTFFLLVDTISFADRETSRYLKFSRIYLY